MRKRIFLMGMLASGLIMQAKLTDWVNPLIGSGGHGHVFVGANVPFGFVSVGPTQTGNTWDWCSGYHYSDSTILGFGQLHLSGTGIGDLGDVSLMPVCSDVVLGRGKNDVTKGLASLYTHEKETAQPGYYQVWLERFGIQAEMTATERVALHRYTFPATDDHRLIIDLEKGIGWDRAVDCELRQVDATTLVGHRISRGWAARQSLYFVIQFSQPMDEFVVSIRDSVLAGTSIHSAIAYGKACFASPEKQLLVKVALSPVSVENALANLRSELPAWDFEATRRAASDKWEAALGKIKAEFAREKEQRIFYTALYHTMFAPCLFSDVGQPSDYTVFSLWDTYRAAHPLATLIHPEKQEDWAKTFLSIYEAQGTLPIWHLMGNETNCMVGSPAVPVLADMVLKGFVKDKEAAYQALKQSMLANNRGLNHTRVYGYMPFDKGEGSGATNNETVAKNLENFLADWSVAQVAKLLGKKADYAYFLERSLHYKKLYDKRVGFFRALSSTGEFRSLDGFNPCFQTEDYTEGNPWQYLWLVPHDVNGLIKLLGGAAAFEARLDALFTQSSVLNDDANPDISGLIGQYAHGNEPSHHVLYLYNYIGKPEKGAARIKEVMETLYTDAPDGLCGNEDVGQMSAWYVLSSLGLYPVEPCGGVFQFGYPLVKEATINVGGSKPLVIRTHTSDAGENSCIKKVLLDGKPYKKTNITFEILRKGGTLEFFMGAN